jgi:4-amino-4-deoxy-L-arabinose transferase-like glycosyltransferase
LAEGARSSRISAYVSQKPVVALILIALLTWLPGFFTLPPLDRDESRFAQASKQMLESGDFIQIRLGDEARDQKPVGIYWLQAASTAILSPLVSIGAERNVIWTYRIPSLVGSLAALLLTFFLVRSFAAVETAFFASVLLGTSLLLMVETHIAKTDAFLLAMVLGAQSLLLRAYLYARQAGEISAPSRIAIFAGWVCFAFGILVKGPIIIAVCAASVIAVSVWDREWRWFARIRPLWGFLLTMIIVLPWLIAIGFATDGAFFYNSLGDDFALKLIGEQESHGAPPGYFTLLVFVTFWPATIVLLPAVLFGIANRNKPVIRYLLLWAVTTFIMFEIAPTKLPHYTLPAYPALAILGALWVTRSSEATQSGWLGRLFRIASPAIFLGIAIVLAGLLLWLPFNFGDGTDILAYPLAAIAVSLAILASIFIWRGQRADGVMFASLTAIIFYLFTWQEIAPSLSDFQLSPRIAEAVEENTRPGDPPVVIAGYAEPSIRFLLGTETQLVTGPVAGEEAARRGGLFVVTEQEHAAFAQVLEDSTMRAVVLSEIHGANYSNGQLLVLTLYRVEPS